MQRTLPCTTVLCVVVSAGLLLSSCAPEGVATGTGGHPGSGGAPGSGGQTASGGSTVTGGTTGTGGRIGTGGTTGTGGSIGTGGGSGGVVATGGATNTGGKGTGGITVTGGTTGSGGMSVTGGATGSGGADASCSVPIGWVTRTGRTATAFNVTGGGTTTPIVVKTWADLAKYASDAQARVIHIDGTLGGGWSGSSGDRLEVKSNKTIVGLKAKTQLNAAIHVSGASNVILRNIVVKGPGSNEDQAWDNINIEGASKNVWVDHCEFWDGQDGNADVVKGPDNVTFTWCIFGYEKPGHTHNLSNLIASSDSEPESDGKLNITYMSNWFKAVTERAPRCRYGNIHVLNNLYTSDSAVGANKLGVTNGFSCNVRTENNHFIGMNAPIDLGKQAGTGSVQESIGNLFENCSGGQKGSGTAFVPPYEYKSTMVTADKVKALVQARAGATLTNAASCN